MEMHPRISLPQHALFTPFQNVLSPLPKLKTLQNFQQISLEIHVPSLRYLQLLQRWQCNKTIKINGLMPKRLSLCPLSSSLPNFFDKYEIQVHIGYNIYHQQGTSISHLCTHVHFTLELLTMELKLLPCLLVLGPHPTLRYEAWGWTLHWIPKWHVQVTMKLNPLYTRSLHTETNVYVLMTCQETDSWIVLGVYFSLETKHHVCLQHKYSKVCLWYNQATHVQQRASGIVYEHMLSYIQHKSPKIVCNLEITF